MSAEWFSRRIVTPSEDGVGGLPDGELTRSETLASLNRWHCPRGQLRHRAPRNNPGEKRLEALTAFRCHSATRRVLTPACPLRRRRSTMPRDRATRDARRHQGRRSPRDGGLSGGRGSRAYIVSMTPPLPVPSTLSDQDLISEVSRLATSERAATAALIVALAELDVRRLYVDQGYASLFVYCVRALGLSEAAAYHRIEAARACRAFSCRDRGAARRRPHVEHAVPPPAAPDGGESRGPARRGPRSEQATRGGDDRAFAPHTGRPQFSAQGAGTTSLGRRVCVARPRPQLPRASAHRS